MKKRPVFIAAISLVTFLIILTFYYRQMVSVSNHGLPIAEDILGFTLPSGTKLLQEKIEAGFGKNYVIDGVYSVPEEFSRETLANCEKLGLSRGGTLADVMAAKQVNITLFDPTLIEQKTRGETSTCYRYRLEISDGLRVGLVILAGNYLLLIDTHT